MTKLHIRECARAIAGAGVLLVLAACAPLQPGASNGSGRADTQTFADALSPPGGVPCRFVRPTYTALQRQLGVTGSVHVTYVVNTIGRIDVVIVDKSSGNPDLDSAARASIAAATCAPYVVDGVAHRVVQNVTINFRPGPSLPAAGASAPRAADAPPRAPSAAVAPAPASTPVVSAPVVKPQEALSLQDAIQAASLQKLGIAPDSTKAALLKQWGKRIHDDPDVSRFFGAGPNHASMTALPPQLRTEFYAEGTLRITPEQRSKLTEMVLKALDNAPPDCGGVKNTSLVTSRYLSLATLSDADLDASMAISYAILKQSALQTPLAQVTPEQRVQASAAVGHALQALLKNDPDATRDVASAMVDPAGVSALVWCRNSRIYMRALLATPQPQRDWSIVASTLDARAKTTAMLKTQPAAPAADDFASKVQRRVRPNIVWAGPNLELETTVEVHCTASGTLLSATVSRSSGNAAWDAAALRAVQRSDPMPVDFDGHTPGDFSITLRPSA